jgi:hypothetical protein
MSRSVDGVTVPNPTGGTQVLGGVVDEPLEQVALASAGDAAPRRITREERWFVEAPTGPPISSGLAGACASYSLGWPAEAPPLRLTDGARSARGEPLGAGLNQVQIAAGEAEGPAPRPLATPVGAMPPDGSTEDTALLGLPWKD